MDSVLVASGNGQEEIGKDNIFVGLLWESSS